MPDVIIQSAMSDACLGFKELIPTAIAILAFILFVIYMAVKLGAGSKKKADLKKKGHDVDLLFTIAILALCILYAVAPTLIKIWLEFVGGVKLDC